MTKLLEQAYKQIAQLSEEEQDGIASVILDVLASEKQWDKQFAASPDMLSKMAQKALQEHREGKTLPLDPDKL